MNNSSLQNNVAPWRILIFAGAIGLIFVVYIVRLFDLQVLSFTTFLDQAINNYTKVINNPAPRGIIYDRNGIILAQNIPSFNIVITQAYLPDDLGEQQDIFRRLSELTGVPVSEGELSDANPYVPCKSKHGIQQIVYYGETSEPYNAVPIACNVPQAVAMTVAENTSHWPGVGVDVVPVRDYPTGELTADVVGFLGPIPADQEDYYVKERDFVANRDKVGYAGIELWFQDELGGHNGLRTVRVDVAGQQMENLIPPRAPVPGENLQLTIDTRLQQAATSILVDEMNSWNRIVSESKQMTSGVVIAINPKTGEILAMVSYPSYENNRMAREIPEYYYNQLLADPREPLRNHAVYAELPAGSVFKLVTATGSLNEGVVTPEEIIKTPGKITISNKYYPNDPGQAKDFIDWIYKTRPDGFGQLDMVHAIANSSNVYFYKVGGGYENEVNPGLGICRLGTYARALGYGNYPGVELYEKADGLIPDPDWKRIYQGQSWTTGDTYIFSVGQGYVLATPLQVLMSAATIANDGKLMEPTLLREVLDGEGNVVQPFTPNMRWDLTKDPVIQVFATDSIRSCEDTGERKTVEPWVFKTIKEGMRMAVTEGTLAAEFKDVNDVAVAGKTGTAEYCDKFAAAKNLCEPGNWPSHAWTVAFAPYEDPEIAVVAFVYNGNEGSTVAGPIVRRVLQAYFELKRVDIELANP